MTFSGCSSYHEDTNAYDEYIAIQYVLNKFEGGMTALKYQARRKRGGWGGWGGFSPPNNLLKFIDFVSEKDCKSHDRRNEDSNSYILEEATRIYQKCSIFDVIQVKNFKIFLERHSLVVILCFRQWHIFQKYVVFQRFKACSHGKFSRGQVPSTPHSSLCSHLASAPPPIWISFRRAWI